MREILQKMKLMDAGNMSDEDKKAEVDDILGKPKTADKGA
jgi:hypothetical protein